MRSRWVILHWQCAAVYIATADCFCLIMHQYEAAILAQMLEQTKNHIAITVDTAAVWEIG
jgi:hypothetical protein